MPARAKPVQISIDTELLRRIDADPETRRRGRSAFVRSAIRLYLRARERRSIETQIARAYSGQAQALLEEAALHGLVEHHVVSAVPVRED